MKNHSTWRTVERQNRRSLWDPTLFSNPWTGDFLFAIGSNGWRCPVFRGPAPHLNPTSPSPSLKPLPRCSSPASFDRQPSSLPRSNPTPFCLSRDHFHWSPVESVSAFHGFLDDFFLYFDSFSSCNRWKWWCRCSVLFEFAMSSSSFHLGWFLVVADRLDSLCWFGEFELLIWYAVPISSSSFARRRRRRIFSFCFQKLFSFLFPFICVLFFFMFWKGF